MPSNPLDDTIETRAEFEFADFFDYDDDDFAAIGIDPSSSTAAKPGSEEKVVMLAARYAAGLPLWHDGDCYDHGPGSVGDLIVNGDYATGDDDEEDDLV